MQEVTKKTLTVTVDQHEAITNMKRGRDTIYDVMDRLIDDEIYLENRVESLHEQADYLKWYICECQVVAEQLKKEMRKWEL